MLSFAVFVIALPGGMVLTYTGLTADRPPHYQPATVNQVGEAVHAPGLPVQSWTSVVQRIRGWQRRIDLQPVEMNCEGIASWDMSNGIPLVLEVLLWWLHSTVIVGGPRLWQVENTGPGHT